MQLVWSDDWQHISLLILIFYPRSPLPYIPAGLASVLSFSLVSSFGAQASVPIVQAAFPIALVTLSVERALVSSVDLSSGCASSEVSPLVLLSFWS